MDLQGNPIPSGQRGVKNTTDPLSNRTINEPSGSVLKDSLAAESVSHGGSFNENRNAEPIGATSQNTTTNTTDTSAATKLSSASNAREREEPHGSQRYPDALGGQAEFPGAHIPETGYVGGSTAAKKDLGINKPNYPASEKLNSQSKSQAQSRTQANASGSGYQTRSATAAQKKQNDSSATAGQGGEFPSDPKYNASFNSELGSEDDPGRLAEQKFQRREAETVAAAAAPAQKGTGGDQTWYQPLNTDQRA
ncbi:hypothetical protein BDW68DRAFT_166724 [Aspergillus falconensis]